MPPQISAIEQERGECAVSVAIELGLGAGLASRAMVAAGERWPLWSAADELLAGPTGVTDLSSWLAAAEAQDADRVLHALVRRGSPTGGDELLAVDVVTWALLPGARALARRLRTVSADVDQLVAAQLWLEVRTFPWPRLHKVAANVLSNTRAHVLAADLPTSAGRSRGRLEYRLVDPHSALWHGVWATGEGAQPDVAEELREVLADATATGVLAVADHELLQVLVEQAHRVGGGAQRGKGGLLADRVVDRVVGETGLSPATVRRRVRRSVMAIADAQRTGLIEAA
ncbi:hypothetical protein GCM10009593_22760 [Microlunatus antarcticus]